MTGYGNCFRFAHSAEATWRLGGSGAAGTTNPRPKPNPKPPAHPPLPIPLPAHCQLPCQLPTPIKVHDEICQLGHLHCGWTQVPAGLHVRYLNKLPAGSQGLTKMVVTCGSLATAHDAWSAVTYMGKKDQNPEFGCLFVGGLGGWVANPNPTHNHSRHTGRNTGNPACQRRTRRRVT